MAAFTTAALVGGGLAAAGSVAGGLAAKSGAKDAASEQLQATRESIAFQKEQADKAAALLEPFRQAQLGAVTQLQDLSKVGSPLELQQREAATQAIQRQLAGQGLLRSGGQSNALQTLELGLAEQRAGRLSQLAGLGSAQSQAGIYNNLGSSVGQSILQQGQIRGQSAINQANATASIFQGIGNAAQGTLGNLATANLYGQLFPQAGGSAGGGVSGDAAFNAAHGISPYLAAFRKAHGLA